jgi:hypothetical protein
LRSLYVALSPPLHPSAALTPRPVSPHQASEIGAALAMSGVISVLLQLFVTPFLLARCELARLYRITLGLWTYCFALLPFIGLFAHLALAGTETGGRALSLADASPTVRAVVWIAIAVLLALSKVACLPFACVFILPFMS